jgi:hypothetical protein
MPNGIESHKSKESKDKGYIDAIASAVGSIAAHFLRENKRKGRDLRDLSRGVVIKPDGTEVKIDNSNSNGKND